MRTLFLDYFARSLVLGLAALALLAAAPFLQRRYSARWFCRAWLVLAVLLVFPLRMFLPRSVPAPVTLTPPFALLAAEEDGGPDVQPPVAVAGSGTGPLTVPDVPPAQITVPEQNTGPSAISPETDRLTPEPPAAPSKAEVTATPFTPLDWLALLWLAGVLAVAGWQWIGYFVWRRTALRRALPADEGWQGALSEALSRQPLKKRPRLLASPDMTGAMAAGIRSPVLLVREGVPPGPDAAYLLAHELTHLRRHDLVRKALFSLVPTLHWYNPAAWLLAKRAGRDMETACDEAVLSALGPGHRAAYCDALLHAVNHCRAPALTTCFSLTKKDVKARFARLWDTSPKRRGTAALAVFCLTAALAGTLVACNAAPAKISGEPPASVPVSELAASPAPDAPSAEEVWPVGYYNGAGPLPLPEGEEFPPVTPVGFASPDLQYAGVAQYGLEGKEQTRLTLWNTSNGGKTWTSTALDCSAWLAEIEKANNWASLEAEGTGNGVARAIPSVYQFVSPSTGFLAYYGGWDYGPTHNRHTVYSSGFVLLRTTDGGKTWQEIYSGDCSDCVGGTGEGISLSSSRPFLFLSEKVGFLCAHGSGYGTNGKFNLLRTVDGGETWRLLDLSEMASTLPDAPWETCHVCSALGLGGPEYEPDLFTDAQPGFAAFTAWGDDSVDRVILYTWDYGETWQWTTRAPATDTSQEENEQ